MSLLSFLMNLIHLCWIKDLIILIKLISLIILLTPNDVAYISLNPDQMLGTAVSKKRDISFYIYFFLSLMCSEIFIPAALSTVAVVVEWGIVLESLTQVLFSRSWCTISVDRSWWQKFKYLAVEHFSAITICIWHPFFVASPFAFPAIFHLLSLVYFGTHPGELDNNNTDAITKNSQPGYFPWF